MLARLLVLPLLLAAAFATAAPEPAPLTAADVLRVHRVGVGEEVLLAMVEAAAAVQSVTPDEVISLQQAGVPSAVIAALVRRGGQASAPAAAAAPPAAATLPPPPPPVPSAPPVEVGVGRRLHVTAVLRSGSSGRKALTGRVLWGVRASRGGETVAIESCPHENVCWKRMTDPWGGGVTCWCPSRPGEEAWNRRFSCAETIRMERDKETTVLDVALPDGVETVELYPYARVEQRPGQGLEEMLVSWTADGGHGWVEVDARQAPADASLVVELVASGERAVDLTLRDAPSWAAKRTAPADTFPNSPLFRKGASLDCRTEW